MIVIDYQDRRPLYEQVTEKLKLLILKGALAPNEQLPSVRSLSMDLSVNPSTIQRAYATLEREGYIYPVKGRGNFVTPDLDLAQREREAALSRLEEALGRVRDLGTSQEEVLSLVQKVFGQDRKEGTP